MAITPVVLWFSALGGQSDQHTDKLHQSEKLVEMARARNVIPDPEHSLITSPGFSKVRSTVMTNAPAVTGIFHLGGLADETILTTDDGKFKRDNANPPGDIVMGTAQSTGDDNLARGDIHEGKLIVVFQDRDAPQTIDSAAAGADLGGTPPKGIDYKVFARRGCMFAPDIGGTIHRDKMSFNSQNDDHDIWANPDTINFLNFGREGTKANVLGGELYEGHLMVFTEDHIFPTYQTPNALLPLAFQDAVFSEEGGGPPVIHSVIAAEMKLVWVSRNGDVKVMTRDRQVQSVGYAAQPFLDGRNMARLASTVGFYEPRYGLFGWAISDGSDTENKICLLLHLPTKQFFYRTISRNAFALRGGSGKKLKLQGGGYAGFFYDEFNTSTIGDLDNAASTIDADIITPRLHLGLPDLRKAILFVECQFDPIGSETITVQYRFDDTGSDLDTGWTSFSSTLSVTGTDKIRKRFFFTKPFERVQLRFRNAIPGERFRLLRYGFPRPTVVFPAP